MKTRVVTYRIVRRADNRFDVAITTTTGRTFKRTGFRDVAAMEAALDDLRAILAVQGLVLVKIDEPPST